MYVASLSQVTTAAFARLPNHMNQPYSRWCSESCRLIVMAGGRCPHIESNTSVEVRYFFPIHITCTECKKSDCTCPERQSDGSWGRPKDEPKNTECKHINSFMRNDGKYECFACHDTFTLTGGTFELASPTQEEEWVRELEFGFGEAYKDSGISLIPIKSFIASLLQQEREKERNRILAWIPFDNEPEEIVSPPDEGAMWYKRGWNNALRALRRHITINPQQ